jgi:hypothetical protein
MFMNIYTDFRAKPHKLLAQAEAASGVRHEDETGAYE